MKTLQKVFAIAILALACAVGAAAQAAQGVQQPGSGALQESAGVPWQLAGVWTFNSSSLPTGGFNVVGLKYFQLVFVPSGTVSACAISFDSSTNNGATFSTGGLISAGTIGSCASAATYSNTSGVASTLTGQLTPTITGTGQVTVALFGYINNPAGGGGSVTVTGNVNTQPAGFGSIVGFQQAVTASAVVLATNTTHGFCVKALPANALTVYVGPSGVTTGNGYPLAAGDSICYQASNSNLAFVIASSTGSSVAVSGN